MINAGDIKVSDATMAGAEAIALYRAEFRSEENRRREEATQDGHHAPGCIHTRPLPAVDLASIYAEALALGVRMLLASETHPHRVIGV